MCGVAGLINLNGDPVSPVLLERMTDSLEHRGPDSEGQWIEGNIGFGHRRLAIIDLTPAGHQPMQSSDGRWILSYNGEIYNFRELRVELESKGFNFRSLSDAEVVLYALIHWGKAALLKFNGMFALSFWDRHERTLLLARDRYGIKPLYYSSQGDRFSFGSEQRAILSHPKFVKEMNKKALFEYFTFQNIFTTQTLVQDVVMLPAGTSLSLDVGRKRPPRLNQYWDFHFREPTSPAPREEYIEELDRLFQQAVNRQLISDVEIGVYLSGGMDSGSITAIASQSLPGLKSFTCGFDLSSASGLELAFDERQNAEALSALFKTEHYEMVLKAGDMERVLPLVARALEEPRVGQSYPNFYAAKLASKFVKVVLSGAGGDELFAGYPWRYFWATSGQNFEKYIDEYYLYWQRLVSNSELKELFAPIWSDVKDVWTRDIFRDVYTNHANELSTPEDYINHSLYFEAKTFLHGLLVVEDKLSMSHGLETRLPFLDNDLVEFAMNCPVSLKLNRFNRVNRVDENTPGDKKASVPGSTGHGKLILREAMGKYIPSETLNRVKQGFSAPDASWFKGDSINFVQRSLGDPRSPIFEFLSYNAVQDLVDQHVSGRINRRLLVWSFLNLNATLM